MKKYEIKSEEDWELSIKMLVPILEQQVLGWLSEEDLKLYEEKDTEMVEYVEEAIGSLWDEVIEEFYDVSDEMLARIYVLEV